MGRRIVKKCCCDTCSHDVADVESILFAYGCVLVGQQTPALGMTVLKYDSLAMVSAN